MKKRIAFFETANALYEALIGKYLEDGYTIYFFKSDKNFTDRARIKQLIEGGKLIDASSIVFRYELYRQAAFFAHENVDIIFEKYFSSSPSIELTAKLLDFPNIADMYKKELLLDLEKFYEVELKINEIIKNDKSVEEIHFIPEDNFNIHSDATSLLEKNIKIIRYSNFRMHLKNIFERIFYDNTELPEKGLFPLFYLLYLFFKKFGGISNNKKLKEFKVGITIMRHPKSIFDMNYTTETIFVDDAELPKEHVLFIDENYSKNIEGYKKRGWNFTRLRDDRETMSIDLFWNRIIRRFMPAWFKVLFLSLFKEPFFIDTKRRILQDYLLWNIFADTCKIKNYVKSMLPDDISKIHILSTYGVKTWYIYPDNTSIDYHLGWDNSKKNQTFASFMSYDNAVVYGNQVENFLKKHRNFIKRYIKNGVLFSQIIRELQDGKLKSVLPSYIKEKRLPKTVIGVFDVTNADYGPVKKKDGITFGNDILRLLDDFPDIGIIFRPVKRLEQMPHLSEIYNKLKNHPRCLLLCMWGTEGISASEVIAFSDFIISCAYTSPSAEALGAKKKAIYYDVGGHDIGDKYCYNNYPNFVAHSYEELRRLIGYWLYKATEDEFEIFLNKYVKDRIDSYLDGKALTRLRKLLME